MAVYLYIAAFLLVAIAAVHSYLGEKYILIRLFKKGNLPKLFGGTEFTQNTLRFAWHITSVAWIGFAAILVVMAKPDMTHSVIGEIIAVTFLIHFLIALLGSKGKHWSWIIFLLVAGLAFIATNH